MTDMLTVEEIKNLETAWKEIVAERHGISTTSPAVTNIFALARTALATLATLEIADLNLKGCQLIVDKIKLERDTALALMDENKALRKSQQRLQKCATLNAESANHLLAERDALAAAHEGLREALEEIMDYPRYESFSACAMSTLAKAALRGEGENSGQ